MSRRQFDVHGNQSFFRGLSRNRKNNSNTDVNVDVDTEFETDIQNRTDVESDAEVRNMNNEEFQSSVQKLEELTNRKMGNFSGRNFNDLMNVRLFNLKRQ